jgi:hypothetical protein
MIKFLELIKVAIGVFYLMPFLFLKDFAVGT